MKGFKLEPVRWATGVLALLVALSGAQETFHILPSVVARWVLFASVVLTLLLGEKVRSKVTALAGPRDSVGRRLVPMSATYPRGGPAPTTVATVAQEMRTQERARPYGTY